jgi:multiple sugar transport system ATP-binding protein
MSNAEVQQVATPAEVYYDPSNLFVARFIGSPGMNLIPAHYREGMIHFSGSSQYLPPADWQSALQNSLEGAGEVTVGFRPEAAQIKPEGQIAGEVYASELYGAYTMLHVSLDEQNLAHIRSDRLNRHPIGTTVRFDLDPEMVRFFNPKTELALKRG